MSEHEAKIDWIRSPHPLESGTYSRSHKVELNANQNIKISASREYKGDPGIADPEQLLVSAVASCHMLFFLALAEARGFFVLRYSDNAVGYLEKGEDGRTLLARISLHPIAAFSGEKKPTELEFRNLNEAAHKRCFIANSVKAAVSVAGALEDADATECSSTT
ncbi:MAG: OsmC family protein [Proteobacteria bacterium]|nr:OsmC family protein [Pseudomonadota bacterium]